MFRLSAIAGTLALVAATLVMYERQIRRAMHLVGVRTSLMEGAQDHAMVIGADGKMLEHELYPQLVGLSYADHPSVKKMWDRVRTGGGFYPMTFRDPGTGHLRSFLYLCGADEGAMRCIGADTS